MKFIYIGGEAPVLEPYIRLALLDHMSESAAKNNHFFLNDIIQNSEKEVFSPTSRTINLAALELKAIDEMKGPADNMPDDAYKILNEKANIRQLTAFVVELVQNEKRYEQLLQKLDNVEQKLNLLDTVENKLDLLLTNGFVPVQKQEDLKVEEPVLQEGKNY